MRIVYTRGQYQSVIFSESLSCIFYCLPLKNLNLDSNKSRCPLKPNRLLIFKKEGKSKKLNTFIFPTSHHQQPPPPMFGVLRPPKVDTQLSFKKRLAVI